MSLQILSAFVGVLANTPATALPPDGVAPLSKGPVRPAIDPPGSTASQLPPDGADPLEHAPPRQAVRTAPIAAPLGEGPGPTEATPLDPKTTRMVRADFLAGPTWRTRQVDVVLRGGAEYGRMHGFSGSVHASVIVATTPEQFFSGFEDRVRAWDVPMGVGAVLRGRVRNKPLYGSVGLSAGILVHRAEFDGRVIHRVDPDFEVPLRLAWTPAGIGVSLALVQGYSVRERSYERRGNEIWKRNPYRIGFAVGLHWDIIVGRKRRPDRRRGNNGE